MHLHSIPTVPAASLPTLSTDQMREVDRLMVEDFGVSLLQMMENAGRNLADLAEAWLGGQVGGRPVLVLAGRGNNGGGGLVAARHLANRGAEVQIMTSHPLDAYGGVPDLQLGALLAMGVSVTPAGDGWELPGADLVLDALIGYGLRGNPTGATADLIRLANSHQAPILALDAPSGLDTTSGHAYDPCIRAAATMTLALPKTGLQGTATVGNSISPTSACPPFSTIPWASIWGRSSRPAPFCAWRRTPERPWILTSPNCCASWLTWAWPWDSLGTVVPLLPGAALIWAGVLVWAWVDGFEAVGWPTLAVLGLLAAVAEVSDLAFAAIGGRRGGASWRGMLAGSGGALLGLLIFNLPGALLGAILGMLAWETYRHGGQWQLAWRSSGGLLLGYLISMAFSFTIGVIMLALFVWQAFG